MTQKIYTTYVELHDDTYYQDPNIVSVDLMQTPWVNNTMWGAFEDCPNLQSVTNISPQVTNMQAAFYNCQRLTSTPILPSSVTSLHSTFYSCPNLTTMPTIPGNVIDMAYSFMYCNNMSTTTAIPNSVDDVCYAFAYTNINTAPILPPNITELNYTFAFCKNLNDTPTIPSNVQTLLGAFQRCEKIQAAPTIPDSVQDVTYTFAGCYNLRTAPEIPNSVLYIDETFSDCYNLSGDIIIRTPNIVHNQALINTFNNTSLRKNVYIPPYYYNDTTTHSETYNAFIEAGYDDKGTKDGVYLCYNYYPVLPSDWITSTAANGITVLEKYIGTNNTVVVPHNDWYSNKVMNTSKNSTYGPFTNNKNIISVDLANVEVTNNNFQYGFHECTNLQSVTNINPNITNLDDAFSWCYSLQTFQNLPPNVTNMWSTFHLCKKMVTPPVLPPNVVNIPDCFSYCHNLTTIPNIPDSVINMYATFHQDYSLTDVNLIAPNVTNLGLCFEWCNNLTNVNIIAPNATNVTNIFNGCTNLTNAHIEFNTLTNAANLFKDCTALVNVSGNISNCTSLATTFYYCRNLVSIPEIPNSVTNMSSTFYYCERLVDMPTIPNSITTLQYTFECCRNLTNIQNIPDSVTTMLGTFQFCERLSSIPKFSNNVDNLQFCFFNCISLVSIPNIPNSVTRMVHTFKNCTNLTGNIYIHSNQVSDCTNCFANTSLIKNVYIPFEYENGVNTATRNSFEAEYPINTISGTTVGTLTDNNGVISGFTASNYVRLPTLTLGNDFEIVIKFTYISTTNPYQEFLRLQYRIALAVHTANNNVLHFNTGNGSSWNGTNTDGITPLISGNTYWMKVVATSDGVWKCYLSTNGITYTLEATDTFISQPALSYYLGVYDNDFSRWFSGSVDLNASYIKVNGQKVWNGYVRPNGVVLKDIDGSKITINPTPADATVLMYSEAAGKQIDETALNKFAYTKTNDDVLINGLNTQDTSIVVPSIWTETNNMRAIDGSKIYYKVFKEGYNTVESEITVDGSQTIDVNLEQTMCIYTVVPMPQDATVTLTTPDVSYRYLYRWGWLYTEFPDLASVPDDIKNGTAFRIYTATGETEYGYDSFWNTFDDSTGITDGVEWVHFDGAGSHDKLYRDPENDVVLTISAYPQEGNSITVPWGTEVSYTVSKAHYTTVTGTEVVKTTGSKFIPLSIEQHTFTIAPTPNDAAVQILVDGRLVNASNSDWVFTANNLNGDIELQEYIGSNTVVGMPISYETTNTVMADYSSTIEWKVSKDGYITQTDTLILEQDTTLNINLQIPGVDTTDYVYTYDGDTLILSKYTGSGTNIETPTIQGISE